MSFRTFAAVAVVCTSLAIGCDDTSEPVPATPTAGATNDAARDAAADLNRAADNVQNRTAAAADAAKSNVDQAVGDVKAETADSTSELTAKAQGLYDQATAAVRNAKFEDAEKYVDQLKGMRDNLPVEWQTRVDDLAKMVTDAKAKLGAMPAMPAMPK